MAPPFYKRIQKKRGKKPSSIMPSLMNIPRGNFLITLQFLCQGHPFLKIPPPLKFINCHIFFSGHKLEHFFFSGHWPVPGQGHKATRRCSLRVPGVGHGDSTPLQKNYVRSGSTSQGWNLPSKLPRISLKREIRSRFTMILSCLK